MSLQHTHITYGATVGRQTHNHKHEAQTIEQAKSAKNSPQHPPAHPQLPAQQQQHAPHPTPCKPTTVAAAAAAAPAAEQHALHPKPAENSSTSSSPRHRSRTAAGSHHERAAGPPCVAAAAHPASAPGEEGPLQVTAVQQEGPPATAQRAAAAGRGRHQQPGWTACWEAAPCSCCCRHWSARPRRAARGGCSPVPETSSACRTPYCGSAGPSGSTRTHAHPHRSGSGSSRRVGAAGKGRAAWQMQEATAGRADWTTKRLLQPLGAMEQPRHQHRQTTSHNWRQLPQLPKLLNSPHLEVSRLRQLPQQISKGAVS